MKLVRFNLEGTSRRVWVLQHDLSSREGPIRKTRPIHVLTFVYGTEGGKLCSSGAERAHSLCSALEVKLDAVQFFTRSVGEAFERVPSPSDAGRDVVSAAELVALAAMIEGYLGAIYTSLELVNAVVRILRPQTKHGFRAMAKKGFSAFQFDRWPWLSSFYDVRTEVCHFGSPLPLISPAAIVLDITQSHETHRFERDKKVTIPLSELVSYHDGLLSMLDAWALEHLRSLDQALVLRQLVFDSNGRRTSEQPTLQEFLASHLEC